MGNQHDDKIKALLAKIEEGTKAVFESDNYRNYLLTMSKFHNYSFRNNILILMQKPEATVVAGYSAWQKKFNRQVQRGEKGIQIIGYTPKKIYVEQDKKGPDGNIILGADGKPEKEKVAKQIPAFMPVYVYDVSQTAGEPLPELVHELDGSVEQYQDLLQAITDVSPFHIDFEPVPGGAKGFCDPINQRIVVQEGMSEAQSIKTLLHEITHAELHAPELNLAMEDRTDRRTKEVEAESTAFVVCSHYGIDTSDYTFPYLAGWSSTKELTELQGSLEKIQRQAGDMINKIDTRLAELKQERTQVREQSQKEQQKSEPAPVLETAAPTEGIQEVLMILDNEKYLHVQSCDTGWDYTLYDVSTMKQLDGGQLDAPEMNRSAAVLHICEDLNLGHQSMKYAPLAMIETLQNADYNALQIQPDNSVSIEEMHDYGYTKEGILPVDGEKATNLYKKDAPLYRLYSNGTEVMVQDETQLQEHIKANGLFGIKTEDWQLQKQFDAMAREIAIKYDQFVGNDKTARQAYPFSIEDHSERISAIAQRIGEYDRYSLSMVVDHLISSIPADKTEDRAIKEQALKGIDAAYDKYQQERLARDLERFGGEPVVSVKWSESKDLQTGQTFPLHEANDVFRSLDMSYPAEQGYDKTAFYIKYKMDGVYDVYEGRQDFGDRDGSIIDHIRKLWEFELQPEQIARNAQYGNTQITENAKEAVEVFVPFLQLHDNLGRLEVHHREQLKELSEMGVDLPQVNKLTEYNTAMVDYISAARTALNTGSELPTMPNYKDFGLTETVLTPEYKADLLGMAKYKAEVEKEISAEAKAAGITPDQYVSAGSIAPAGRTFTIYQMNDTAREYRFMGMDFLSKNEVTPTLSMYDKVYSGSLPEGKGLEDIYTEFNINHPADFEGHSLSVSDVVTIEYEGTLTANYVDGFDFQNIPELAAEIQRDNRAEALATDLDHFSATYDNYAYKDNVESREEAIQSLKADLLAGSTVSGIVDHLREFTKESKEYSVIVAPLVDRLSEFVKPSEPSKQYTHFYYENKYLFTVQGDKAAAEVYDRLTLHASTHGFAWSDDGNAYKSDKKEAPKSDRYDADKSDTTYKGFTEKRYQAHEAYLDKIYASIYPKKENLPVGRIDFLGTNGQVGESIEYTNIVKFSRDIEQETSHGAPIAVVLYRDADGKTLPTDRLLQLDPPPKSVTVEDNPKLPKKEAVKPIANTPKRMSMKDRMAAAKAEADRRNSSRKAENRQPSKDHERGKNNV